MIRSSLLWLVLLAVVVVLHREWQAGDLSTVSFVILGFVATFELGCLAFLFRGFSIWHRDPWRLEQERRRAANRLPRKRFG